MTQNCKLEFAIVRSDGKDYLCLRYGDKYAYAANITTTFSPGKDTFEIIAPDPAYRTKLYTYHGQPVRIVPKIYPNGWLAITVANPADPEEYKKLTFNFSYREAVDLPCYTYIDIYNQPDALRFLVENGLVEATTHCQTNGYESYPMVFIPLALLYQHEPDAFQQAHLR